MVKEGEFLWRPSEEFAQASNVAQFMRWLAAERGHDFADYNALWRWSVDELEDFWAAVWDYFQIHSITPYKQVLDRRVMPGAKWFEGSRVNFAEHMLRHEKVAVPEETVFRHLSELRPQAEMSWHELGRQVRKMATQLRALGVVSGDRVVSYMPNIPETAVAMLAATAIGAVWSSAAPEFGVRTVIDRFAQIRPKIFFAADGYRFAGKDFDRSAEVAAIAAGLPELEHIIWLPYLHPDGDVTAPDGALAWHSVMDCPDVPADEFSYEYVAWDHPLWVLYSSGTTGLPKAIVHTHVGILAEQFKSSAFHVGLKADSSLFFYSTTGWVMWNALLCAMLQGATAVLYDGAPAHPTPDLLWQLAAETGATCFGTTPTYVQIMEKHGLVPRESHDLSRLSTVFLTGSPSMPETFEWFYRCVKEDLWLTSQSGGTDLCSGLVGASPTLPVHAGEIQTRLLGMDVHAWNDDGKEVIGEVGELVVTNPFPSMPIFFWNDTDGRRYHESYFDHFPGVWRQGDFIKINERGGCYIYGRSDSTLNRYGVRIGSSEIYRTVDRLDEIADSLIVGFELPGGGFFMPLFVKLAEGAVLDEALRARINDALRRERSPRHVPDKIYQVDEIPYTLTGKKMEIPVRKILTGARPDDVASRDAMAVPGSIDWFEDFARSCEDYDWRG